MGVRSRIGDVFLVPLHDDYSVGQVIDKYKASIYVIMFNRRTSLEAARSLDVASLEPIFASLTFDAFLFHEMWPVVFSDKEAAKARLRPLFKVRIDGRHYVESFEGEQLRPATRRDEEILRYRNITAPIGLDHAVKAFHGLEPWQLRYEDFRYEYVERSALLAAAPT